MTKTFSIKHNVTEQDLNEFNAWIKSKKVTPKLRKEFKSDQEYENFMIKEQDKKFSEIKSEDEFRKYAHTVMKQAHGDEYSEETTNKVVDDLIKDNPNADWGELIGRLTSGFGDKSFSLPISNDPSIIVRDNEPGKTTSERLSSMQPKVDDLTLDWNVTKPFNLSVEPWLVVNCVSDCGDGFHKGQLIKDSFEYGDRKVMFDIAVANAEPIQVFVLIKNKKAYIFKTEHLVKADKTYSDREKVSKEMLEKAKIDGVVQKKPNGKWGIISIQAGEWWNADYDSEDNAKAALAAYHANKGFSFLKDKSFSTFITDTVEWEGSPESSLVTLDNLIGTVAFSVTYCHLFHWSTQDYPAHLAFESYYEDMPDLIDKLAESAMARYTDLKFMNIITPGKCPIEYLYKIQSLCNLVPLQPWFKECKDHDLYASQISNISELITGTIYKLERLSNGHKLITKSEQPMQVTSEVPIAELFHW